MRAWVLDRRDFHYFARHYRRYDAFESLASLLGEDPIWEDGEPVPKHHLYPKETP